MKKLKKVCTYSLVILAGLHLIAVSLSINISALTALLGLFILLTSIPVMNKSFRLPTVVFFLLGGILLIYDHQNTSAWIHGINTLLRLASIVTVMQLFRIPIKLGDYREALEYLLLYKTKSKDSLFLFVTLLSHVFGSFLLFGTIPVLYNLLGDSLRKVVKNYERFITTSFTRGFPLISCWAPGAVNILLVHQATGVQWIDIVVPGFVLSSLGIITSVLLERKTQSLAENDICSQGHSGEDSVYKIDEKGAFRRLYHILVVTAFLLLLTISMDWLNWLDSTDRVLVAGGLVVAAWISFYLNKSGFKEEVHNYLESGLSVAIDIAGLFIAMGIFAEGLSASPFMGQLSALLAGFSQEVPTAAMIITIPAVIVVLALLGIHPFISLVIIGKTLTDSLIPLNTSTLAFCLILGGAVSYMVSPFGGIVLTLSNYLKRTPFEIAIKWNGLFAGIFFIEGILIILFLNAVIF